MQLTGAGIVWVRPRLGIHPSDSSVLPSDPPTRR